MLDAPTKTQFWFDRPKSLSEWIVDGQVAEGYEAGGLAFPPRVMATLGRVPSEYLVIGEARYSDGRFYLDFGMNPAFIEETSEYRFIPGRSDNPVYVCPDCQGISGEHHKVSIPSPTGIGATLVKCPRDTRRSFGR